MISRGRVRLSRFGEDWWRGWKKEWKTTQMTMRRVQELLLSELVYVVWEASRWSETTWKTGGEVWRSATLQQNQREILVDHRISNGLWTELDLSIHRKDSLYSVGITSESYALVYIHRIPSKLIFQSRHLAQILRILNSLQNTRSFFIRQSRDSIFSLSI